MANRDHVIACLIEQTESSVWTLMREFDEDFSASVCEKEGIDKEDYMERFASICRELNTLSTALRITGDRK